MFSSKISIIFAYFYLCYLINYICVADFPKGFLENIVESDVVKARLNSRWKWEVWDVVPGTHIFNIYLFNLTNPTEFENGARPILQQVGPYSYAEHRSKYGESVNLDLSVNYERRFAYTFDPGYSKGQEDDLVNLINVPFIIFSTIASEKNLQAAIAAMNSLAESGERLVRTSVRVGDVIFDGMDVSKYKPYLNLIGEPNLRLVQQFLSGKYGVFKIKSGANEGPYTVDSGLTLASNFGVIRTWNHGAQLEFWSDQYCNMINGTDGTVYPPNVKQNTILQLFDIDMCRSIQFKYSNPDTFRGSVDEFKFKLVDDLLEDPKVAPKNLCFCKKPPFSSQSSTPSTASCMKKGVLDVSACQEGAPWAISYPHFLNADPEYLNEVVGLKPDPALHETFLDIQPELGVIISYNKRFQWNLQINPIPNIHLFKNIKPMLMPILWNDDNFQLDEDKAELLIAEIANRGGGMYGGASSRPAIWFDGFKLLVLVFVSFHLY